MVPPPTPASSPFARPGIKSSYRLHQPEHSSPLAGSSSPTYGAQPRRKREYKSHTTSRSPTPILNPLAAPKDTPQKELLRERFRAQCMRLARQERARAMNMRRGCSSENGSSSSDGVELENDVEDEDILNDELYRRVMINETRRFQHAQRVSFEREFGSSIDPDMYDDMGVLEWEMTGRIPTLRSPSPPSGDFDDALIEEYLAELEEMESWKGEQEVREGSSEGELAEDVCGDLQMSSPLSLPFSSP